MSAGAAPRFVLVAGETSGDQLGAGLIRALRQHWPLAQFAGIGGPRMAEAGMDCWFAAEELALFGLVEVIRHLPRLLRLRRELYRRIAAWQPQAYIGIDAPDFNLTVERKLRQRSSGAIRTVHYVSPSIWAWRQHRAAKIGQSAELVLCLFPFEPALYARYGVRAEFVGHLLAEAFPLEPTPHAARAALGLPLDAPVLALLPGSRQSEIQRLGRDFLDAVRLLRARHPRLLALAPMANARCRTQFQALLQADDGVELLDGRAQLVLQAADVVLIASGTATLEAALARRSMVVAYRVHPVSAWIGRTFKLIKSAWISLPNQLVGRVLVPELLQEQVQPALLCNALDRALQPEIRTTLEAEFAAVHHTLRQDADARAAAAIVDLLAGR